MSEQHEIRVECKAEGKVLGTFVTNRSLNAEALQSITNRDAKRYPVKVLDGTPMQCLHCHSQLYFRDATDAEFVAIPGTLEVLEDLAERTRRAKALKAKVIREADDVNRQLYQAKESRRG